jgi:hypothetical protein
MDKEQAKKLEPIEGEEIHDSLLIQLGLLLFAIVLIFGDGFTAWAWWTEASFLGHVFTAKAGVLSAVLCSVGIVCVPLFIMAMLAGHRLILGTDCLQEVFGKSRVTAQVPYRNVAKMELIQNPKGESFIGIDLLDPDDAATYCGAQTNKSHYGWHYVLKKGALKMPLQQVYDHLMAHYQR